MAGGETVNIQMTGGGPWGFRLFGGEDEPLVVAKLRRRSKAHEAGLCEDDAILVLDGYSCRGMNHPTAMSLIDCAGDTLTLQVLRGAPDKDAIHAALQALGPEYKEAPRTNAAPRGSQSKPNGPGGQPLPTIQLQVPQPSMQPVINGHLESSQPNVDVQRHAETFQEGDTTTHVTTETRTEKLGSGTTVTRVTRQQQSTTTNFVPGPTMYSSQPQPARPRFQAPKPAMWTPPGGAPRPAGNVVVRAPGGVSVHHHPDQSVTMTIGFGQGNTPPSSQAPLFKVNKFATPEQTKKWAPGPGFQPRPVAPKPVTPQAPPLPPQMPPQMLYGGQPLDLKAYMPADPEESLQEFSNRKSESDPNQYDQPEPSHTGPDLTEDNDTSITTEKTENADSTEKAENTESQPWMNPVTSHGPEKMYADSSFYADPQHKYPTIEEQIKLARKVALSLTDPNNRAARGHKMFVKRRQRANKWTTGLDPAEQGDHVDYDSDDEKSFRPNPWNPGRSWQPQPQQKRPYTWEPSNQSLTEGMPWKAPTLPYGQEITEDKKGALSKNEYERLRLFDAKNIHDAVSPQMCFNLVSDLKNLKGRGGKLFAKRQARAQKEDWVVDDTNVKAPLGPPPSVLLAMEKYDKNKMPAAPQPQDTYDGMPQNRLSKMIDPPKAAMTPWEAALEFEGNVDPAFDHLAGYHGKHGDVYSSVKSAAKRQEVASKQPTNLLKNAPSGSTGPSKMPAYTRKIKPWGQADFGAAAGSQHAGMPDSTDFGSRVRGWQGGSAMSGEAGAAGPAFSSGGGAGAASSGFKSVKFRPGGKPSGMFEGNVSGFSSSGPQTYGAPITADHGYCDL